MAPRRGAPLLLAVAAGGAPVPLIIDTDIGGGGCMDVDDVNAVCIANALEDLGEAKLLAVVHNTSPPECAGAISVLNHYYGRDDIPIGSYKNSDPMFQLKPSAPHRYVTDIVASYPSPIKNSSQVPTSVEVYRKVLAAQPDHSVVISSIGLLTNLAALLRSQADQHSPLSGVDLVAQKVRLLAEMGGRYPSGSECNMQGGGGQDHATGAAASGYVFAHWPRSVEVIFSGFEVGVQVHSGGALTGCAPEGNPCRQANIDFSGSGNSRLSWDPLTTLVGVRGAKGGSCSEHARDGSCSVDPATGSNEWVAGPAANQTYLLLNDATAAGQALDTLLCHTPAHTPPPAPQPTPPPVPGMCALATGAMEGAGPAMTGFGGGNYTAAWDGDIHTFYDYSKANGGWTQAALLGAGVVAHIDYYPRGGQYLNRFVGGRFVGISQSGGEVELATITSQPEEGWTALSVGAGAGGTPLTAVKYESPNNGYGNIAEIRLFARC